MIGSAFVDLEELTLGEETEVTCVIENSFLAKKLRNKVLRVQGLRSGVYLSWQITPLADLFSPPSFYLRLGCSRADQCYLPTFWTVAGVGV